MMEEVRERTYSVRVRHFCEDKESEKEMEKEEKRRRRSHDCRQCSPPFVCVIYLKSVSLSVCLSVGLSVCLSVLRFTGEENPLRSL